MRHKIAIILLLSLHFIGCSSPKVTSPEDKAVQSVKHFLDELMPDAILLADAEPDTAELVFDKLKQRFPDKNLSHIWWGHPIIYDQDSLGEDLMIVALGKLVDDKNYFAAVYLSEDSLFCFFRLNGKVWDEVGREYLPAYMSFFEAKELNGKEGNEILASSSPNMNGNVWSMVFCYNENEDRIRFAGDICTYNEFNPADTTVHEEYGGSWYMDLHKTVYVWHEGMLVPYRHSLLVVPKGMEPPFEWALEYYENPELRYDAELQLIFRETHSDDSYGDAVEHTEAYKKYWENFFELGRSPLGSYKP